MHFFIVLQSGITQRTDCGGILDANNRGMLGLQRTAFVKKERNKRFEGSQR